MDRQEFIDKLGATKEDRSNSEWANNTMINARHSADINNPYRPSGYYHLDICKEECAELIQELSKETRGEGDFYNILQELADVAVCVRYVQMQFHISDELLGRAMTVKLNRVEDKLNKVGKYQ